MPKTTDVLTADRVEEIFRACLFTDDEDMTEHVRVEGIVNPYGFHPGRLAGHAEEIGAMLGELPDSFKRDGGGGMSFLNACEDRHGRQWTGLHQTMDRLFALGMGVGKVELLMPREMWAVLPGGMPYYVVMG